MIIGPLVNISLIENFGGL